MDEEIDLQESRDVLKGSTLPEEVPSPPVPVKVLSMGEAIHTLTTALFAHLHSIGVSIPLDRWNHHTPRVTVRPIPPDGVRTESLSIDDLRWGAQLTFNAEHDINLLTQEVIATGPELAVDGLVQQTVNLLTERLSRLTAELEANRQKAQRSERLAQEAYEVIRHLNFQVKAP